MIDFDKLVSEPFLGAVYATSLSTLQDQTVGESIALEVKVQYWSTRVYAGDVYTAQLPDGSQLRLEDLNYSIPGYKKEGFHGTLKTANSQLISLSCEHL